MVLVVSNPLSDTALISLAARERSMHCALLDSCVSCCIGELGPLSQVTSMSKVFYVSALGRPGQWSLKLALFSLFKSSYFQSSLEKMLINT